jgi:uncharacterized membrane protein
MVAMTVLAFVRVVVLATFMFARVGLKHKMDASVSNPPDF